MAIIGVTQKNWAGGELSPKMAARDDLPIYKNGAEKLVNFISDTAGPKRFRSGFSYVLNTRRHNLAWFFPFKFNDSDAYELEFSEGYVRFFRRDGSVLVGPAVTISGAVAGAPVTVTATSHGFANGDEVIVSSVLGMTQLNNRSFVLAGVTTHTFQLLDSHGSALNGSAFSAYISGGVCNRVYEIKTPYLIDDIPGLKIWQNADTMYIDSKYYEPRKLVRSGALSWALNLYTRTADPFTDKKTITAVTKANPAKATAVGHGYSTGQLIIIETVGGMVELNSRVYSLTKVDVDNFTLDGIDSTGYTTFTTGGYASDQTLLPGCLAGYQGRMYHAGSGKFPESLWGSKPLSSVGEPQYDDYTLGTNAADAFKFTLQPISGKVDVILSLVPGLNYLAVCTVGGVSKATGGTDGTAISPSTIDISPVVTLGCLQQITPFLLGITMLYIHRSGLVFFSLEFDIFYNAYNALDKNLTNDHWTQSGIIQMDYAVGRPTGFWFVRADGVLVWLSYQVKENINAADRMLLGGTSAKTLSVGVMPRVSLYDQAWIISERVIGGRVCRFVEYQNDDPVVPEIEDFWSGDANKDADTLRFLNAMFEVQKKFVNVDAAITYDGSGQGLDAGATLTPGALTGTDVTFTAGAAVFSSSMVGRQLWKQAQNGVGSGRAEITSYVSSTQVVCNILTDFDTVTAMPAGQWYLTTDTVGGAWHLEGEIVKIVADGGEHPELIVVGGSVTIQYQAGVIHLGLGYTGMTKSMHLGSGSPQVPSDSRDMNVNRLGVKFLNALGARYGTDLYKMQDFQFPAGLMGRPKPLFSGHLRVAVEDMSALDKHIYIQQARPLPCTIEDMTTFTEFEEG